MKAVVYRTNGPPEVLRLEDIEKPVPGDDDVLIKVHAASVNPLDWKVMKGIGPPILRTVLDRGKPKLKQPGVDAAGVVEAVGRNVVDFKTGDEVFGACRGSLAEYAISRRELVGKPLNVTFEQAASVPVAALTALQGLRDKGRIRPGQRVLINGAAGGVGTFAVQIAKFLGAHVTGVCSTGNLDMVRSIGADRVIDYTREDFTQSGERFDVCLDCVGNRPLRALARILEPKGILVMVGAASDRPLTAFAARLAGAFVLSRFVSRRMVFFIAKLNREDLTFLGDLISTGQVRPVIDRCYRLSEAAEAFRYAEAGHARGKVVITVQEM